MKRHRFAILSSVLAAVIFGGVALFAQNPSVQFQTVLNLINNLQAQLNSIQNQINTLTLPTGATSGQFVVENQTATAPQWVTLSGDVTNSTITPGQLTVTGLQGKPICPTAPNTVGQVEAWNGTQWCPAATSQALLASCSQQTVSCTGNGTTTLTCGGGIGDFLPGQGVYIGNGSAATSTITAAPSAPTAGVGRATRLDNCSDVTVTGNAGGSLQFVSASQCKFDYLNSGDIVKVTGSSNTADNGVFTVSGTPTATTLKMTVTGADVVAGDVLNFQTMVPSGGGTIVVNNCAGDLGVTLDPQQRPFNMVSAGSAYGTYNVSVANPVCTYTFMAADSLKPATIYYELATVPVGSTNYCFEESAVDGIQGGHSQASTSGCTGNTATITFPILNFGTPFLWVLPSTVAGAYAYDMYEKIGAGSYFYATRVWPPSAALTSLTTLSGTYNVPVSSTLGFPPPTQTLTIGGNTVTCTGSMTATSFVTCTGGTGTAFPAGTLVQSTTPNLNITMGGGIIMGQHAWQAENVPATPPATAVNEDFSATAPPTVVSTTPTSITLTAAAGTGTFTVAHTDQNVLASALNAIQQFGGIINIPASCVVRFCQMPFNPALNISSIVRILGTATNIQTSELQTYCDGGGPWIIGQNPPTYGAIANPGHLDMENLEITSTNSALGTEVSSNNVFFTNLVLDRVSIDAVKDAVTGISHTTNLSIKLLSGWTNDLITRYGDRPIALNSGVNGFHFRGVGSINQGAFSHFLHGFVEYFGSSINDTFGPSMIFEVPWTLLRPADGQAGDIFTNLRWSNNYQSDVVNMGANALVHGSVIDAEGTGIIFDGGQFGQAQPGLLGFYFGSAVNGSALLNAVITNAGLGGVLAENNANPTIIGGTFNSIQSNNTAVEIRGVGTVIGGSGMVIAGGATGTTAFKLGYQGDGVSCNTASSTEVTYRAANLPTTLTPVNFCSTARIAEIRNDAGYNILQGTKPTVTTCGTGSPSVATGSTNVSGTFTTGTGGPTACTLTFATAVQANLSGTPLCTYQDTTAVPMAIGLTSAAAAPNATQVLVLAAVGAGNTTSHVVNYHCDWHN